MLAVIGERQGIPLVGNTAKRAPKIFTVRVYTENSIVLVKSNSIIASAFGRKASYDHSSQ